jgi:hypothetical protein
MTKMGIRHIINNFLISIGWDGVRLGPLGTATTNAPIAPAAGDYDDGEIDGMIGRGNQSTRRKPNPAPLLSITKSHMTRSGFEPGPLRWEASD